MQKCLGIITEGWQKWSEWSSCNASCGHGQKQRQRECSSNKYDSSLKACPGSDGQKQVEKQSCFMKRCPYCEDATICDDIFSDAAFDSCKQVVDVEKHLQKCRIEVCQSNNLKAPTQTQENYMQECASVGQPEIVCGLKEHLSISKHNCPINQAWSSCKPQCQALRSCTGINNCDDQVLIEGCFCKEGYVMSDGENCIRASSCETHWEEWSSCSVSCGSGTKIRHGYKDR